MKGVVLVTGGTRGIGDAICLKLLKKGFYVIAIASNPKRNHVWLVKKMIDGFEKADVITCDITDFDKINQAINTILSKYGCIDILVNNAGITRDATLKRMSKENWFDVIQTNLNGIFNITKPVIENMINNGWGRIINISSINAQKGQFGQTNYSAAKAGIHGFTKALAQEVANKNITVNTISPGYIDTEMMQSIPDHILQKIKSQIPMGRLGTAEEVADLVSYLTQDSAAFITGANIAINGGQHMF